LSCLFRWCEGDTRKARKSEENLTIMKIWNLPRLGFFSIAYGFLTNSNLSKMYLLSKI
jgi:hypothetical protein